MDSRTQAPLAEQPVRLKAQWVGGQEQAPWGGRLGLVCKGEKTKAGKRASHYPAGQTGVGWDPTLGPSGQGPRPSLYGSGGPAWTEQGRPQAGLREWQHLDLVPH